MGAVMSSVFFFNCRLLFTDTRVLKPCAGKSQEANDNVCVNRDLKYRYTKRWNRDPLYFIRWINFTGQARVENRVNDGAIDKVGLRIDLTCKARANFISDYLTRG